MKSLIFDSGPLISLTMNGMLPILEKLKKEFPGDFIITPQVRKEVVNKPMSISKYKFEAIRVQDLIDKGILELSSKCIKDTLLEKETNALMKIINSVFSTRYEKINLVHEGEVSCLAFSKLCRNENAIVIDERTIRMLIESPKNLKDLMERKLHTEIKIDNKKLFNLFGFKFIRSSELIYIAYKKSLIELKKNKENLEAMLYALKFTGTAISSKEIKEIKALA